MGDVFDISGMEQMPLWANGLTVLVTICIVGGGAHILVDAAARIAKRLGISELVIGLTVVALGTSAPEFAVTLIAAFQGQGDISVGNIVGSNIFNLGFILGGCAIVRAIPTSPTLVWRDGSVLVGTTLLLLVLIGWDLRLDRHDGILLFVLLGLYLGYLFMQRKVLPTTELGIKPAVVGKDKHSFPRDCLMLVVGLAGIVGGSHLLIGSASAIARDVGISEWVIGVTIVAAGTSAPELATSLAGVLKGRYGISAGNLIGSDIFNLLGVLGLAGMLRPIEVDVAARLSLVSLSAMVFLVFVFLRTGWRLSRLEGAVLVALGLARWAIDFLPRLP